MRFVMFIVYLENGKGPKEAQGLYVLDDSLELSSTVYVNSHGEDPFCLFCRVNTRGEEWIIARRSRLAGSDPAHFDKREGAMYSEPGSEAGRVWYRCDEMKHFVEEHNVLLIGTWKHHSLLDESSHVIRASFLR